MDFQCCITNGISSVTVFIFGYERLNAEDYWDANWLRCQISLNIPPFKGDFNASILTFEFGSFEQELKTLLALNTKSAKFKCLEGGLSLDLEVKSLGQVIVSGNANINNENNASLAFSFETELGFIERTHREVLQLIKRFPVIGSEENLEYIHDK